MAFYVDEEEVWKCPKHPSKRRRSGICPVCLRDRLASLCPDCANARPCTCSATTSSSSSSSSSFYRFSVAGERASVGAIGRVSKLIDSEPAFRRSRSFAIPFLRSKFPGENSTGARRDSPVYNQSRAASIWSLFKANKSKKTDVEEEEEQQQQHQHKQEEGQIKEIGVDEERRTMMRKSRSVAVTSISGAGEGRSPAAKGRGWHFPSPIKAFRQTKIAKVVQERSPLYRG